MNSRVLWATFFCLSALARALADEVVLTDGRIVEGKVEDLGSEVRITKGKNAITFPKSMVKEIRYKPTKEEEYAERVKRIDAKDPEAQFDLGRWCADNGLKEQAADRFRKTIEIQPDHEGAHLALGHRKLEGRWLSEDEFNAAKGLVKYKGEWVTPQEKELSEEIEKAKEAERDILRQVRKAMGDLASNSEKRQVEAESVLGGIGWEYKLKIFISSCSSYSTRVRRYVAAQLGLAKDKSAIPALGHVWLYDIDEAARKNAEASIGKLGETEQVFNILLKGIFSDRRDVSMRSVAGLADHKDPRSIPYLVDLLQAVLEDLGDVTPTEGSKDVRIIGKAVKLPDGTEAVIPKRITARTPMKELEEQEKAKERQRLEDDRSVIIKTLATVSGQDFGSDLAKWRAWLAEQARQAAKEKDAREKELKNQDKK